MLTAGFIIFGPILAFSIGLSVVLVVAHIILPVEDQ